MIEDEEKDNYSEEESVEVESVDEEVENSQSGSELNENADENESSKVTEKNNEYIEEKKHVILDKNDFIITAKGLSKVIEIIDEDDPDIMKLKLDVNGKKETVNYRDINFSISKNIRVIVSTYENKLFDLQYPVNINSTFEDALLTFCEDYLLMEKQVCMVFKGNKVSKKEKEKLKFNKDFELDKDFLLFIIGPSQESHMQINKTFKRLEVKEFTTFKYLIKVSKPIFLTGLYLFSAWYDDCMVTYKDFCFSIVNNMPEEFRVEPKKEGKKKKSTKVDGVPPEAFDNFFFNPDKFEMDIINNFDSLDAYREAEDYRSDSESEREEDYYEKKIVTGTKMHKIEFDKYLLVPEKYYYISMKVGNNTGNVCCISSKVPNRVQSSKSSDGTLNVKVYLPNNQKESLLIGGLSWMMKSCFN